MLYTLFVADPSAKTKPLALSHGATGTICWLTHRLAQTAYISAMAGTILWAWSLRATAYVCPVAHSKAIWDQSALHSPRPTIVILSISQQGRTSQLPVWNMVRRGAAWTDPQFDSIVCWRWLQGRNEECTRYSWNSDRCRCLGINTASGRHESHTTFHIQLVFITNMLNELSFTQMTQTLSKYVCTTVQGCGEICRNCGYALRTAHDRYLQIHDIAAVSRN